MKFFSDKNVLAKNDWNVSAEKKEVIRDTPVLTQFK